MALYFTVSGAWAYYAYWCFGRFLYKPGHIPPQEAVAEQAWVSGCLAVSRAGPGWPVGIWGHASGPPCSPRFNARAAGFDSRCSTAARVRMQPAGRPDGRFWPLSHVA